MAEWNLDFPEDFLGDLITSDSEELCKELIDQALPIVEANMRKEFQSHIDTGALARSVKATKAKKAKNGFIIGQVVPKGTSSHTYGGKKYKVTNALKAIWLENGTVKQPARPWLNKVLTASEEQVAKKMQEIYEQKVGAK